jgi:predicted MFS family arabinose efflux permease
VAELLILGPLELRGAAGGSGWAVTSRGGFWDSGAVCGSGLRAGQFRLRRRARGPVFTQAGQGHSAAATGLALLPQGIITGLGTVAGQKLLSRVSVRATVVAGFALLTVASLGLLTITATTPLPVTAAVLAGRAAAIGLVITPLLGAITSALHPAELADASTVFNIGQRIAGALGTGLIAALFTIWARTHGAVPAVHATGLLLTALAALAAALLPGRRQLNA